MVKDAFATFEYAVDEQDIKALHNATFSTGEGAGGGLEGLAKRLRDALFGELSPGFLVLRTGCHVKDGTDESERRARLTSMSDSLAEALASEVLPQSADLGEKTGFVEVHRSEAAGFSGWNVYRGCVPISGALDHPNSVYRKVHAIERPLALSTESQRALTMLNPTVLTMTSVSRVQISEQ